jgi:hypothetical protein
MQASGAKDDLLLRIRAENLHVNLSHARERLAKLPNLDEDLQTLSTHLDELRHKFFDIRMHVIEKWTNDWQKDKIGPSQAAITEARSKFDELLQKIEEAHVDVHDMKQLSYLVQDKEVAEEISNGLGDYLTEPQDGLESVEDALKKASITPNVWKDFRERAELPSSALFSQCIEVLGGIALRDSRFDHGICELAEELIRTYQPNKSRTRAFPAGCTPVEIKLARVVRLSFPEWTIWSLPLVAHEFWHAAACQHFDKLLRRLTRKIGSRFDDCLADVFATFTMGPAYAYAAIVLTLDPTAPYEETDRMVCHEIRSHVILRMLRKMDVTKGLGPFKTIAERLKLAWEAAKAQTGAQPSDDQKKQLDKDLQFVEELVSEAWKVFENAKSVALTPEVWEDIIHKWRENLLRGRDIELTVGASLSHALNAAWAARVDQDRDFSIDLLANAQKLVDQILEGQETSRRRPVIRGVPA